MKTILRSDELSCPSCIGKIEKALKALPGVIEAKVHFNSGRIDVEHDTTQVNAERLQEAVRNVGYGTRISAF
ncbi:MAG TPA: heavy-metal-associated domain-containing protein [Ottowia sp.]|jgi:copper chaperone CopZ|uniref:heavy-metal-associated domain-containing protein n=1 Tax=Ottowia sp. TaxID=1898956 RepID=UPI002CF461B7|nr:heavy-metal-associated domain-containing protein [Ottowia sp.]HMN21387.1 heavy-metal-associated domain-containing protein [Ottowia sp.]